MVTNRGLYTGEGLSLPSGLLGHLFPVPSDTVFGQSIFIFSFFCFLGPHPRHMEAPRGRIGAAAPCLRHSHSHTGSKLCLRPTLQLTATLDP